ncbi:MAG: serine O-acetyltransferase [Devosiaceae bacterium]
MNKHSHPNEVEGISPASSPAPLLVPQDPIWRSVRDDALAAIERDGATAPMFEGLVLNQANLGAALIAVLAGRLCGGYWGRDALAALLGQCQDEDPEVFKNLAADIQAVYDRDPACHRYVEPLLFFKGFHALQAHRFSHHLWNRGRKDLALFIQSRMSEVFQVDIHPATAIGGGIFFDHATGIVIGETAVIYDNVSIMQNVTLGGTGKAEGDRHPKVLCGVLVGSGAKVLGNIELGQGSRVAASSVVLEDVPALATVAGIPAKIVSIAKAMGPDCMPSLSMDHQVPQQSLVDVGSGI